MILKPSPTPRPNPLQRDGVALASLGPEIPSHGWEQKDLEREGQVRPSPAYHVRWGGNGAWGPPGAVEHYPVKLS